MFTFQTSPRAAITPVAGQRVTTLLENNVQTHAVRVTVRGTVTISGGATTTIYNGGSILAAFSEVGIRHGRDLMVFDPLVARFVTELLAPQPLTATRLTSTANGAYNLVEQFTLYAASPYSLNPRETALMERNVRQAIEVFVKQDAGAAGRIADGTVAVSGLTVEVDQEFDAFESALPYFQPQVSQLVIPVNGTNTKLEAYIRSSEYLRGIILTERTTGVGQVSDILNSFALRSAARDYIGPEKVKKDNWQRATETWAGGDVYTPSTNASHTALWFQKHGRLSSILPPTDTNLRLVLDVQESVTPGAGSSEILVHLLELVRDPYQGPDGRRVASPDLPFIL